MKRIHRFFMLWQGLVLLTFFGYGQGVTNVNAGPLTLIKSQSKNPGDNVHCSLQDRKGNLWFATTADGVFRYDGTYFTNFTTKDGLNSNGVFAIYEDKKGNIWFGTDKGVSRFDGKFFTYIPISMVNTNYIDHFNNKPATTVFVNSILEDKNGKFWFGAENGIYCYDGKTFTRFIDNTTIINPNKFDPKLVLCMIEDKKGNIWFTTRSEGIYRFDGSTIVNFRPNNENWFRGLLEDKDGNIWIGRRYKGVCRYDGKTFTNVLQNGLFDSCTVIEIRQDKAGNIWFATEAGDESKRETEGGVWRYDGKIFQNISKKDDLRHHGTWCVLEDNAGNFWIGTRATGLYRYDGKAFTCFSE
ncbi:MAG: two-component regulator propeller domain-containing protein [Spirosomataceae bacterium]